MQRSNIVNVEVLHVWPLCEACVNSWGPGSRKLRVQQLPYSCLIFTSTASFYKLRFSLPNQQEVGKIPAKKKDSKKYSAQ
jgi:hypothetical protein